VALRQRQRVVPVQNERKKPRPELLQVCCYILRTHVCRAESADAGGEKKFKNGEGSEKVLLNRFDVVIFKSHHSPLAFFYEQKYSNMLKPKVNRSQLLTSAQSVHNVSTEKALSIIFHYPVSVRSRDKDLVA
jgi:hypothetical protein